MSKIRRSIRDGLPWVSAGPHPRPPGLGKADLHIHSQYSDGLDTIPQILDYVENETDLDLIAIADHDDVRGALEMRELAARRNSRVQVITATEITTRQGHLLALFVERDFPMLKSLRASMEMVLANGGICIAPHPLSWITASIRETTLLDTHRIVPFHGVETFSPTIAGRMGHQRINRLNSAVLRLPELGSSDAHALSMIGLGYTYYPGRTVEDFRAALAAGATVAGGRFMDLTDHTDIAVPNMWRSMIVSPSYKLQRAIRRRMGQQA